MFPTGAETDTVILPIDLLRTKVGRPGLVVTMFGFILVQPKSPQSNRDEAENPFGIRFVKTSAFFQPGP